LDEPVRKHKARRTLALSLQKSQPIGHIWLSSRPRNRDVDSCLAVPVIIYSNVLNFIYISASNEVPLGTFDRFL